MSKVTQEQLELFRDQDLQWTLVYNEFSVTGNARYKVRPDNTIEYVPSYEPILAAKN